MACRAWRAATGLARLVSGSEWRRAQASTWAISTGGWLPDRPRLNAQPYSAVRNTEAGGWRAASAIRAGVMVASASAIPAGYAQRHAAISLPRNRRRARGSHGDRGGCGPARRLPGGLIEFRAPPGGADQLGPEPIGQRPRGEGPGPGTAPGVPGDLERATAVPAAPDRIDPHIEHVHGNLPADKRSVLHRVGPAIEPEAAAVRRTCHQPPMLSIASRIPPRSGLPFHRTTSTQGDKAKGTRDSTPRAERLCAACRWRVRSRLSGTEQPVLALSVLRCRSPAPASHCLRRLRQGRRFMPPAGTQNMGTTGGRRPASCAGAISRCAERHPAWVPVQS